MSEAPVRMSKHGLVVDGEGWFVINARDSRWKEEGPLGAYCTFEGKRRFPHFGINISVLEPGERMGMYHREKAQETFLVLAGECTLIVEGKQRRLARGTSSTARRKRSTSSSPRISSRRSCSPSVRAVEGSAEESSTRSARPLRGTEQVSCARRRSPRSHMRRSGPTFPGHGLSNTGRIGFPNTTEASPAPAFGKDASLRGRCPIRGGRCEPGVRLRPVPGRPDRRRRLDWAKPRRTDPARRLIHRLPPKSCERPNLNTVGCASVPE